MKSLAIGFAILISLTWLYILVTDTRVLLTETKVARGQSFVVEDHGDLGDKSQSSIVCKYFNGRGTLQTVYWYSSNNFMGKDSCPFINKE